jgi:hypothetical protein
VYYLVWGRCHSALNRGGDGRATAVVPVAEDAT